LFFDGWRLYAPGGKEWLVNLKGLPRSRSPVASSMRWAKRFCLKGASLSAPQSSSGNVRGKASEPSPSMRRRSLTREGPQVLRVLNPKRRGRHATNGTVQRTLCSYGDRALYQENRDMKKVIFFSAGLLLAGHSFAAQSTSMIHGQPGTTYQAIGNSVFGGNGTTYQKIGKQTFGPQGSTSQRIGNSSFNSNGTSSQQVGKTLFKSDGSTIQRIGNTTFGSDGITCQQIGNQTFCN